MDNKAHKPFKTAIQHYESTIKSRTRELEIVKRVVGMTFKEQVEAEYKLSRKRKLTTAQRIELSILRKGPIKIINYGFETEERITTLTTELAALLRLQTAELQKRECEGHG